MDTIMIQVSERQWTMRAMHLACAMARNNHANLVLLNLRPVTSPMLLGTGLGVNLPTDHDLDDLNEFAMIAEDYGVMFTLQPMEYVSLNTALAQAVEYLNASVLFAHMPEHTPPVWQRFQKWNLRRQLSAQHCQLYTLDQPESAEDWTPAVSLKASR